MLTTRRPHHRGASLPSASNNRVPQVLDALVLKALSPRADARHQSAASLAAELRSVAASLDAAAADDEEPQPSSSSRTAPAVVVAVLLVLGVAVAWWLTRP
jgi:hypothetical protein